MATNNEKETTKKSASQRIEELEVAVGQLYSVSDFMVKDLTTLKNAIKLLNNKVSAMVEATRSGKDLTDEVLDSIMIENNVKELDSKVKEMITNGIVSSEESVSENSFIVGSESDENGKVVNPRIQFAIKALNQNFQEKLIGKKPGETVSFEENKLTFKILESYKINGFDNTNLPGEETLSAEQVSEQTTEQKTETPTETA